MEERINNLENQLKAALEELESIKKELAEEKARNATLQTENSNLKEQVKEWQVKYEEEHKIVIKLTEENEQLKLRIVDLENQLKVEDEKPYDVADMKKYIELQNAIRDLTSKLDTLDAREKKADAKLLNMIQETKTEVTELKDDKQAIITEVADLMETVDDLQRKSIESNKSLEPPKGESENNKTALSEEKPLGDYIPHNDPNLFADVMQKKPEMQGDDYLAFYDSLE